MEIRVLRYFLESARTGSITRAAERLHVTQPTLSRQLKGLEEELGKKLFVRGSASIRLTDEGRLLKERAEDILSMVDRTAAEFRRWMTLQAAICISVALNPRVSVILPVWCMDCRHSIRVSVCICIVAMRQM